MNSHQEITYGKRRKHKFGKPSVDYVQGLLTQLEVLANNINTSTTFDFYFNSRDTFESIMEELISYEKYNFFLHSNSTPHSDYANYKLQLPLNEVNCVKRCFTVFSGSVFDIGLSEYYDRFGTAGKNEIQYQLTKKQWYDADIFDYSFNVTNEDAVELIELEAHNNMGALNYSFDTKFFSYGEKDAYILLLYDNWDKVDHDINILNQIILTSDLYSKKQYIINPESIRVDYDYSAVNYMPLLPYSYLILKPFTPTMRKSKYSAILEFGNVSIHDTEPGFRGSINYLPNGEIGKAQIVLRYEHYYHSLMFKKVNNKLTLDSIYKSDLGNTYTFYENTPSNIKYNTPVIKDTTPSRNTVSVPETVTEEPVNQIEEDTTDNTITYKPIHKEVVKKKKSILSFIALIISMFGFGFISSIGALLGCIDLIKGKNDGKDHSRSVVAIIAFFGWIFLYLYSMVA